MGKTTDDRIKLATVRMELEVGVIFTFRFICIYLGKITLKKFYIL